MADPYLIPPKTKVHLRDFDPADTRGFKDDDETRARTNKDLDRLQEMQELLYASRQHAVLIVIQGIDTAGKDGTIRCVFTTVNPQGCRVACFKTPTEEELAHDYLWRIHQETPAKGQIVVFNRSHYESVLVERVHKLVPPKVWRKRYDEINGFERVLARSGTLILKFFLNLSKKEQKARLEERLRDPDKRWKANPADWRERRLWDDYHEAFDDMLSRTSTRHAPWYVIPSDHKWYRNMVVADRITDLLKQHAKAWGKSVRARGAEALREAKR
jgi:PPK2 family polyphosphate:nucleotide phosphotransferase